MAQPFLALITPLSDSGNRPDNSLPGQQPGGIWGGGNVPMPTPPIFIPPPGSGGVPSHPIYNPPYPSQGPGFPTHPIAPGGPPLGMWGPGFPYPDQGLPGGQPYPDQGLPGGGNYPDNTLPGGQGGIATHPIAGPHWVWSPVYGWVVDPTWGPGGKPGSGAGGPRPDQGLPGAQPKPDQELPE